LGRLLPCVFRPLQSAAGNVATSATLPAFYADHHALAVDVTHLQERHFGAPHPRAVGRILEQMDKFGLLDGKGKHSVTPIPSAANAPIVRKTDEDAAVLLKNEDGALPLKPADLASLALIGPGAGQSIAIGEPGEKALGIAARQIGTLEALRRLAPTAKVTYAVADDMTGTAVPAGILSHDGQPGLLRTDARTKATQVDPQLNFTKSNHQALPAGGSYTWAGTLHAPSAG
jgi:beta-glucosidase